MKRQNKDLEYINKVTPIFGAISSRWRDNPADREGFNGIVVFYHGVADVHGRVLLVKFSKFPAIRVVREHFV